MSRPGEMHRDGSPLHPQSSSQSKSSDIRRRLIWRFAHFIHLRASTVLAGGIEGGLVEALPEGQLVKHFQYGSGVVTESNDERTTIDFDQYGLKKFVTSLMTVEVTGEVLPKPERSRRRKKPRTSTPRH